MHGATFFLLAAVVTVAYAAGQYYVPRSYYVIDAEGHESEPVPLRRLRRSLNPYPFVSRAHVIPRKQHGEAHVIKTRAIHLANGRHLTAQGGWRTLSRSVADPSTNSRKL